jgi:hypothetical protein
MAISPTDFVPIDRPKTNSRIFAHTRWDAIPVGAALLHCAYFFGMFYLFPRVPLWVMLILGFTYSVSISWNINGISHNFIHNPYFRSPLLNRLFSILESITVGFGQIFYECIHMQHHKGNADLPDEHGDTIDWISIYKHGHDGGSGACVEIHVCQLLSRGSKDCLQRAETQEPARGVLGSVRAGVLCHDFCNPWHSQLALHLFPSCRFGTSAIASRI